MASPTPEPTSTGVVALESARRTLSVIIADRAIDIHYSADALSRLTERLSVYPIGNQVAENLLARHSESEASAVYRSIAKDLGRLRDKEEMYRAIFEQIGRILKSREGSLPGDAEGRGGGGGDGEMKKMEGGGEGVKVEEGGLFQIKGEPDACVKLEDA
ncbi:hypothetical protein N0V85_004579 [Neurospora sp. IMI 360204]|nr:hypothetical protein N0V85_004579 [Neurospora sp. IMI 360204]